MKSSKYIKIELAGVPFFAKKKKNPKKGREYKIYLADPKRNLAAFFSATSWRLIYKEIESAEYEKSLWKEHNL